MNLVLLPRFRPRIIEVVALFIRNFDVGFLDAAQHFVIQLLLEALRRLHHRISVGVLGLQISFHFGVFLVSQPIVVIHELLAMDLRSLRSFLRDGGRRERRRSVVCRQRVPEGEDQGSQGQKSDSNTLQSEFSHRISFVRFENSPILYQPPSTSAWWTTAWNFWSYTRCTSEVFLKPLLAPRFRRRPWPAVVVRINTRIMPLYALLGWSARSSLLSRPGVRSRSCPPCFSGAFLERCPARLGGKSRRHGHHQALRDGQQPRVFRHNFHNRPVRIHRRRRGQLQTHGEGGGQDLDGSGSRGHQRWRVTHVRSSTLAPRAGTPAGASHHSRSGCRFSTGQWR